MSSLIDGLQRILRTAPPNQIFVLTTAINFINSHTESLAREAEQAKQLRELQAEIEQLKSAVDSLESDVADKEDAILHLHKIGQIVGCEHTETADCRARLVHCVRQEFERLKEALALSEGVADVLRASVLAAEAKAAEACGYGPLDTYPDEDPDEPAVRLVEVLGPAASDPDDAIEIPPWRPE